jgi:hypothetical protein
MFALLAACSAEPQHRGHHEAGADETADTGGSTTSWTVPTATDPAPFDPDALGDGLNGVLAQVLGLSSEPVMASYDAAMQYQAGYCPSLYGYPYGYGYVSSWYAQCDSDAGATYSGYVSDYVGGTYRGLYASATILSPDGDLSAAGYWATETDRYGQATYRYDYLDGVFSYDGPEARGTWIEDQVQAHYLTISRGDADGGAWHSISADGQYTGASGSVDTVDFDYVSLDSRYGCPEPAGTISLRTPAADWFEVTFGDDDEPCDGCGTARWRGLEVGQVCGDFTIWTDQ